jgi:NADH-quinone oxidoreductase subunit M
VSKVKLSFPLWWTSVWLPVIVGIIAWITKIRSERAVKIIAALSAATLAIPGLAVAAFYATGAIKEGVLDPWYVHLGTKGIVALVVDGLSAPIVAGISAVTSVVAVYSIKYMTTRIEEMTKEGERVPGMGAYYLLYNVFSAAMLGLAMSTNLVEFYVFLELTLVPSYLLIAYWGYGDRRRISLLYFVWTHIGAVLFLTGVLYYGIKVGTFDYIVIPYIKPIGNLEAVIGASAKLVAALMLLGLFVKMAVFGVHMWLPYAHAEAPTPVSALLSPNLIGLAGYAIARILVPAFPDILVSWRNYLVFWAFLTIIYGGLVALRQTDFKRFLAYSSISQMGYLLLGIGTMTAFGIAGAMLHYLVHAIGKAILFMTAGLFITELHGLRDIRKMGGMARFFPFTAASALFGFMCLVGMPPSPGLWSEWLIILGTVRVYSSSYSQLLSISVAFLFALSVSAAYSFITMRRIFYGQPRSEEAKGVERKDSLLLTIAVLVIVGVIVFLASGPIVGDLKVATYKLLLQR